MSKIIGAGTWHTKHGVVHSQGFKNHLLQVLTERHSRQYFYQISLDIMIEAVNPFFPWLITQGNLSQLFNFLAQGIQLEHHQPVLAIDGIYRMITEAA